MEWLFSRQNKDGGWAAFDVNNTGSWWLRRKVAAFSKIMNLFDPSSACVTGHVLEALGALGATVENSAEVRSAVVYLKKTQDSSGRWQGRWGVNYLYGTAAAVVG